jgi:MFS family permease
MNASTYPIAPVVALVLGIALMVVPRPFGRLSDLFYLRLSGRKKHLQEPAQRRHYEREKRDVRWILATLLVVIGSVSLADRLL